MKLRDVYILNGQTLKDSDTVTVDIARGLKILFLQVHYEATNGATSNTVGRLNGMVSKLSIIDGSTVLHSLSMVEEQAKNFFDRGHLPYQFLSRKAADVVKEEAFIDFWREDGDAGWYLDTSGYSNPQLQFTHALTISATAGFATGTGKLTVIARVIDSGAPARAGFVMAKEIDSFASAASGDHNTDLPLDFPISQILVLDPVDGSTPDASLSNFKLTADTDAFIPVNIAYLDLIRRNIDVHGYAEQRMQMESATPSWATHTDIYTDQDAAPSVSGANQEVFVTSITANAVNLAQTAFYPTGAAANTAAAAATPSMRVRGAAPMSAVVYRFGDGKSPDQVFSPAGVGKFQLKLTQAAVGATPKVVVAQLHP